MSFKKPRLEIKGNFHDFKKIWCIFAGYACHFESLNWLRNVYKITLYEIEFKDIFES